MLNHLLIFKRNDAAVNAGPRGQKLPLQLRSHWVQRRQDARGLLGDISLKDVALSLLLVSLFVMSAIGVVYSSHLCRQLFAEHAVLLEQNDQLQLEWAQLLLEESAWSSPARIEAVARQELGMSLPVVEQIELVR